MKNTKMYQSLITDNYNESIFFDGQNLCTNNFELCNRQDISYLPNDLTVNGYLFLNDSAIKELPKGLSVGLFLDLSNTKIKTLPKDLYVGEDLNLSGTLIKELPDDLVIAGSLDLSNTQIQQLPSNLIIDGLLNLKNTKIETIPNNLVVTGLILTDNGVIKPTKHLINGTYVHKKYLYANDTIYLIEKKRKIGKYTFYKGRFTSVISNGEYYIKCNTFKEGVFKLQLKHIQVKGEDVYKNLSLESVITTDEFRIICNVIAGIDINYSQRFFTSINWRPNEKHTIQEYLKALDCYGGFVNKKTIKRFFRNKH